MDLTVAFLFVTILFFLILFPTIVFFSYSFLVLLPLVLFFWLYLSYFHGILPIDLVATLILLSVFLILFPFLLFQIIAIIFGLLIIERLKNQQNHAFLLTKSAVGTFGQRLITYRKIFMFFFLACRKRIFNFIVHQWAFFFSILALIMTIFFLNTLKMIDVQTPSKVAKIFQ